MSTQIYLGAILTPEQEKELLVDRDTAAAFQALHKNSPAPSWWRARGTAERPEPAWVGFPVEGLPTGPLPLTSVTTRSFRYGDTLARWRAYRDFVLKTTGVEVGEGTLFVLYVDHDDD